MNGHIEDLFVRELRFGFTIRYFSIQRLGPFTLAYQNAAPKSDGFQTLILSKDSTLLVERVQSRAVCQISLFCVLERDLPLSFQRLDLARNISYPLLHRKGLQTLANTHELNSVCRMHTFNTVLLGSSVLVLEADISPYSV